MLGGAPSGARRPEAGRTPGRAHGHDVRHAHGPAPVRRGGWRSHPAFAPVAVVVAGLVGAVYLYGTDPHHKGHWLPRCPFNWLTGELCPACGGTRMVYDLMHRDPVRAFHDNMLLLVVSPLLLAAGGRWLVEGLRGRRWSPALSPRAQVLVLGVAVLWTVARNVH